MPQADTINEKRENHAALHILARFTFGGQVFYDWYEGPGRNHSRSPQRETKAESCVRLTSSNLDVTAHRMTPQRLSMGCTIEKKLKTGLE